MKFSDHPVVLQAIEATGTEKADLINQLDDVERRLSAVLELEAAMSSAGAGGQAIALLKASLSQTLAEGKQMYLRLGQRLLFHSLWDEAERLAHSIESNFSVTALWIRGQLAIEKYQYSIAADILSKIPDQQEWIALKSEGMAKLALLKPTLDHRALLVVAENALLPLPLKARLALVGGNRDMGITILEASISQPSPDPEALWLAGTIAAEAGGASITKAESFWSSALAKRPRHAACLYDRGRYRLQWGETRGADDLRLALEIKPWAGQIAVSLARWYLQKKSPIAALKTLDITLAAREDQPEVIALTIDALRLVNDKNAALRLGEKAIGRFPDHGDIGLAYGAVLQQYGYREKAISAYEQVGCFNSISAATLNNLAKLLFDEGDTDAAIAKWEEALIADPTDITIEINLAHARLRQGSIEEAADEFRTILSKQHDNADSLRGLAMCCLAKGDQLESLEFAQRAIQIEPGDVRSYLALAKARETIGEIDAAISVLQSGFKLVENPLPLHKGIWGLLIRRRDYDKALMIVRQAAKCAPQEIEYPLMIAETLVALNRFEECRSVLLEAKQIDTERGGMALVHYHESRNNFVDAEQEARSLLEISKAVRHYGLLGEVLYRLERYSEALDILRQGVAVDPLRVSINQQLVGQLLAQERFEEAIEVARSFLMRCPKGPQYRLCIEACGRGRRPDEAYMTAEQYLTKEPDSISARLAVAHTAERINKVDRAINVLREGLLARPGNSKLNRAVIAHLLRLERYGEALSVARNLLARAHEKSPDIVLLASRVLIEAGLLDEAQLVLSKAASRHRKNQGVWGALYAFYRRTEQHDEAERMLNETIDRFGASDDSFKWVIGEYTAYSKLKKAEAITTRWQRHRPEDCAPVLSALVIAEMDKKPEKVAELADLLLQRWPYEADIQAKVAASLGQIWRLRLAIGYARNAVALRPNNLDYVTQLMALLTKAGDYDEFDTLMSHAEKLLGDKKYAAYIGWFFLINCHPDWSAEKIFRYHQLWGRRAVTPFLPPQRPHRNSADPSRMIRIGYVSPDFKQHVVARFSEPLLVHHDRTQFELHAFAHLDPGLSDEYTERFKSYFHQWTDISALSDEEFIRKVREQEIDILVDLAGHTKGNRLRAMVERPAPLQVSWAGGSGQTTGLEQIDYLFSDDTHIPQDFEQYCTERVERIDWTGYPYRPPDEAPEVFPLPCLEQGQITFACFSRPIRLGREILSVWASILNALPDAKLRLEHLPYAESELQALVSERFERCGGRSDQLIFANTRPYWDAFAKTDIVLDTFPTGSGTTTTESLWMGTPVITLQSRPIMGRFTHCQLKALGIDDICSARNVEDYIAKAIALANNIELLKQFRKSLRQRFKDSNLMNYQGYADAVAVMYRRMWQEWCGKA